MLSVEKLLSYDKSELPAVSENLGADDITMLVGLLTEKDDKIRYQALLLLLQRSANHNDVYPFWDAFKSKLKSGNSYQRSIGSMLLAENARWDVDNKTDGIIDDYLLLLNDEKPITIRQCIQHLEKIIPYKGGLNKKIAKSLIAVNIYGLRDTMQKLVLMDILNILAVIRKNEKSDEIESYISNAFSCGLLDKKSIKQIQDLL